MNFEKKLGFGKKWGIYLRGFRELKIIWNIYTKINGEKKKKKKFGIWNRLLKYMVGGVDAERNSKD